MRKGPDRVTVSGPLGECVLFVHGRKEVAQVSVRGPASAVAALPRHLDGHLIGDPRPVLGAVLHDCRQFLAQNGRPGIDSLAQTLALTSR